MELSPEPFRVVVKESAQEENEAARRLATTEGEIVGFDSEADAHQCARGLSEDGETPVKVQRAAPQDPADVNGYLVAWPERRRCEPDGTPTEGLTFDVGANQYGALGEALVCSPEVNPPLLTHFARLDADLGTDDASGVENPRDTDDLRVELDADPEPVVVGSGTHRWEPDCRAIVRLGPDRPVLKEYWCEVKTGDGAFERSQREAMEAKAREAAVLKIRVALEDLPDSYTAWVQRVQPDEKGPTANREYRVNASLSDF